MNDCIFSAHCSELVCDRSCPILAETTYLLERNEIQMSSDVFHAKKESIIRCMNVLDVGSSNDIVTYACEDTIQFSELLTYCAICRFWKGNQLHCNVYNLKLSKFLEETKQSWSKKFEPESLEYTKIWMNSAKVLIVSALDYVNFKDFECQTLLNLLQSRKISQKSTIIVTPSVNSLVGYNGPFFMQLKRILSDSSYSKLKVQTDKKAVI